MNTKANPKGLSRKSFLRLLAVSGSAAALVGRVRAGDPETMKELAGMSEGHLQALIEMVRHDIAQEKAGIIAKNIKLSDEEASKFWPIQRDYEMKLRNLLDRRVGLIRAFVKREGYLTDDEADKLAKQYFDYQEDLIRLRKKYYKKLRKVIGAVKAARFIQIENRFQMLVDLKIAASVPIIRTASLPIKPAK